MALEPLSAWKARLLKMKPARTPLEAAKELADFYGDLADKIEAENGSIGIFKFNRALFVAQLVALGFTPSFAAPEWAEKISTAWNAAVAASVITPGTVKNELWLVSIVDLLTVPTGASTIITLSAAKPVLFSGLIAASAAFRRDADEGIEKFAKAFLDATKLFKFLTIGLVPSAIGPVELPIPTASK